MRRDTSREGFALMAALWMVVLVGAAGYELSARARTRRLAVANALEQAEARAAADGALETARALVEQRFAPRGADTIRMGDAIAVLEIDDAGARLDVNRASEDELRRLLAAIPLDVALADRLAQRIADWRDADTVRRAHGAERADYLRAGARVLPTDGELRDLAELREVDGLTSTVYARIAPYLATSGSEETNVNAAPSPVLHALPGVGDEAAAVIVRERERGTPVRSLDELARLLGGGARDALLDARASLERRITFDTRSLVARTTSWRAGSPIRAHGEALFSRGGDAVFVVRHWVGE